MSLKEEPQTLWRGQVWAKARAGLHSNIPSGHRCRLRPLTTDVFELLFLLDQSYLRRFISPSTCQFNKSGDDWSLAMPSKIWRNVE